MLKLIEGTDLIQRASPVQNAGNPGKEKAKQVDAVYSTKPAIERRKSPATRVNPRVQEKQKVQSRTTSQRPTGAL